MKTTFTFLIFLFALKTGFSQIISNSDSLVNVSHITNNNVYADPVFQKKQPIISTESQYFQGQRDAQLYYKKYKGPAIGTSAISFLFSPLVGLIPAIVFSASTPKVNNLGNIESAKFQNADYYVGYTNKAKKIKQRKVWGSWAGTLLVNTLIYSIVKPKK